MKTIQIDIGVCTALTINLTNVDFTGIKEIIFTVKNFANPTSPAIIERSFTEAGIHDVIVKPEESVKLVSSAEYDFDMVMADGTRHKMTDNGKVILRKGVGDCLE
jgi:hypothetical protein